jgi:hypothetical protein
MRERYRIEVGLALHPAWFCKAQRCDWTGNPTAHVRGIPAGVIGRGFERRIVRSAQRETAMACAYRIEGGPESGLSRNIRWTVPCILEPIDLLL